MNRIRRKYIYWKDILERRRVGLQATKGHQVRIYNWSRVYSPDLWLVNFIEKRGLLIGKPKLKIGLYSIFAPDWLTVFDDCDLRIFVARENLHKPEMKRWEHQFLNDNRFQLSIGFDNLEHDQYLRIPFWMTWNTFQPTDTYKEIKERVLHMNNPLNHSYDNRKFACFLCSHSDPGRQHLYDRLSSIDRVDCDGRGMHNNDTLRMIHKDDKLSYLRDYRFNLTPENSNDPYYCTEKLMEAFQAGTVPIYFGCNNNPEPDVINSKAIVFIKQAEIPENQLKLISELNSSKDSYMEFATQPCLLPGAEDVIWEYYKQLETKLKEIIKNV